MSVNADNATSIKDLIEAVAGGDVDILQGTVTSVSPLKIQMVNDSALVITDAITYVPRHLQDYETTVDISGGTLNSQTASAGSHSHSVSGDIASAGDHTHSLSITIGSGGDPAHTHSANGSAETAGNHNHGFSGNAAAAGDHTHALASWSVTGASMTVHNALKVGDKVHVLSLYNGKQYYVLDRI